MVAGAVIRGVFVYAMRAFIRAGKNDSEARRRLGLIAKDPLDPILPTETSE